MYVQSQEETSAGDLSAGHALSNPLPPPMRLIKRAIDLALGGIALIAALPVLALTLVAIRLDSPGPAIFRQVRIGVGGRQFVLYKLRTMWAGNDESVHQTYVTALIRGEAMPSMGMFKLVGDPRVTRVGRILRRFSLDELPQLWNVLRGEMSLVGPRPPLPREVELYDRESWQRLRVKPGLTGLWQVSGRCQLPFEDMVELDIRYWQDWTPWLDLKILLRTPAAVISARGAS